MFEYIVNWITDNGPLLSGIAALIAIVGVFVSPVGRGIRHVVRRFTRRSTEFADQEEAAPAARRRPSVAVMPFKNTSGEAGQDYLADGLTEDIITTLSYGPSFDVIAPQFHIRVQGAGNRHKRCRRPSRGNLCGRGQPAYARRQCACDGAGK